LKEKVNALSPSSVLKRGYSITRRLPQLTVIKDAGILRERDRIEVKMFRGKVEARVELVDRETDDKRRS
jgi:exodeoxyribonuclease VII large subunit